MSPKFKQDVLVALPIWLAAAAFAIWGFVFELGKASFPGFAPLWSGAVMAVFFAPITLFREWMYDTGKWKRPQKMKLRPWVRESFGMKKDEESK